MTQTDMNVADQSGADFLGDINDHLEAIATSHSGTSRPSTVFPGQCWIKTDYGSNQWGYYLYDGGQDILLGVLNTSNHHFTPTRLGTLLGTASTKDTGTSSSNLPTNANLPSSSSMGSQSEHDAPDGVSKLVRLDRLYTAGALIGIGQYVVVQEDLTGAEPPPSANYIRLEAGLTAAGEYNEGKLTNESVTGSAPLVVATADIDDTDSPMNGQTVHLLMTEDRYIVAGTTVGAVANDQMQQITGSADNIIINGLNFTGALDRTNVGSGGASGSNFDQVDMTFDSAESARTGDHTAPKHIQAAVYLRYK